MKTYVEFINELKDIILNVDKLNKSLSFSELSDININTADYAAAEVATKNSQWKERLRDYFRGFNLAEKPRELGLNDGYVLSATMQDFGIYSGTIRNMNSNSGEYGDVVHSIEKMPLADLVIDLKAKGYISEPVDLVDSTVKANHDIGKTIINIIQKSFSK